MGEEKEVKNYKSVNASSAHSSLNSESSSLKSTHDNTGSLETTKVTSNLETTISSKSTNSELIEGVWFSYLERRWKTRSLKKRLYKKSKFFWTGQIEIWDYQNCSISLARSYDEKLKIVIRRKKDVKSTFMDNRVEIRRIIGFDLEKIYEPKTDIYTARENKGKREIIEDQKRRWVFQFNDNCFIWEWEKEGQEIESSNVYRLYYSICNELENPSNSDNFFESEDVEDIGVDLENKIIPVIYQPAVDSLNNYLRIVHCVEYKTLTGDKEIEVSLIFNNEQLRKNEFLNGIYEIYRYYRYGRTRDIETFIIRIKKDRENDAFVFYKIYSGNHHLEYDSIHGDSDKPTPEHKIKYYFKNRNHPIIFINTSNHAMAEHDTNHILWKWEYIPWIDKKPIKFGDKKRNEIEDEIERNISIEIKEKPTLIRHFLELVQKYRKVKRIPQFK